MIDMPCNCGNRNKTQITSAQISETAGVPTEGARTLAQRREAEQRLEAARQVKDAALVSSTNA